MLLTGGCSAANRLAHFGPGDVPAGEPRVLPAFCEEILKRVPPPAVTRKTNAQIAYTKTADALDEANDRIDLGGGCMAEERAAYAGKKEQP